MTRPALPAETREARLLPLPKLPIFLELAGARAVVAGNTGPVAWKAELLAAAGARVFVYAGDPAPELQALIAATPSITWIPRPWQPADLDGAAIAVAGASDDEATRFAAAARERNIPVNVIDQPACCDFQFGAIVNRAPVVVAISTDGAAPVLAQAVRRRIEAILPHGLSDWSAAAKRVRARLSGILPLAGARRRFWEAFVDLAFAPEVRGIDHLAELEGAAEAIASGPRRRRGEVVIIPAGHRDPELLTLKAVRALQGADVIAHEPQLPVPMLELGRREAQRLSLAPGDDIVHSLAQLANAGRRVVWLAGTGSAGTAGVAAVAAALTEGTKAEAGVRVRLMPGIQDAGTSSLQAQ
ncbi:NAD(P)-dependent oxidoreductase [Rhodoligotrophos defluvii]|uniref:NAD(P)-dependent oxidoreductase n=1 Tax=Rhodoligotrophos defluvii TaxID=2561934 RepID=UPI0010C9A75E|nr:NAD(P)-dependent oxidoreductase [Rhodoligotrophos defluvii]